MLHTKILFDFYQVTKQHFQILFDQLDPVQLNSLPTKNDKEIQFYSNGSKENPQNKPIWNFHFAFAFFVFVYSVLDINFGILYEATGRLTPNLTQFRTSPYIIFHQVVPKALWAETDNLLILNATTTTILLAILIFKSSWPEKAKLYRKEQGPLVVDDQGKFKKIFYNF